MKEENKDLYRIDPLKVRKKIFDSYSPGSTQRKSMVKEEKISELERLNSTFDVLPRDLTTTAVDHIKSNSILSLGKAGFFTLVALILAFILITTTVTPIELVSSLVGIVVFGFLSLRSLLSAYANYKLIQNFSEKLQEMEAKISNLKKDIFDEPGR